MLNIPFHRRSQYEQFIKDTLNGIHPKTSREISILFTALSAIYHDKEKLPTVALQSQLADRITYLQTICNHPDLIRVPSGDQQDFKKIALAQVKKKMEELKSLDEAGKNHYIQTHLEEVTDPLTPWVSNYTPEEIEGLFALVNLGSIYLNMSQSKLTYSDSTNLSFTLEILQTIVKKTDIPPADKIVLKKLIQQYKKTLEIENLINQFQNIRDPKALLRAKKHLLSTLYAYLEKEGTIYLPSGYAAEPAGHAVMIKLTLERDIVFAEIVNRGEGSELHGISLDDSLVFSSIHLPAIFLHNLKNSAFLRTLLDLQIQETSEKTSYSIQEFYHVALTQWPNSELAYTEEDSLRGAQRGGTCSLKQFISPLRSLVSRETEKKIKLHMRMRILELFLELDTHTEYTIHQIEWTQAKISKSCNSNPFLSETDRKEAMDLLLKADDRIQSIKAQLRLKAHSKMQDLSGPVESPGSSILEILDYTLQSKKYAPPPLLSTKSPEESLADLAQEYESLYIKGPFQDRQLCLSASILILNYLKRLPLATDPLWTSEILNSVASKDPNFPTLHYVGYIRLFVQALYEKNFCSGDDIALIANAMAGALRKAASENEDQVFISQQASTLLYLLTQSKKQLRIQKPENEQFLEAALEVLQSLYHEENILSLSNAPRTIQGWHSAQGDLVLTFPTLSFRQIHNIPFLEKVYKEIELFKQKSCGPYSTHPKYRHMYISFRRQFGPILDLSESDSSTEKVPLEECTFKFIYHNRCNSYVCNIPQTAEVSKLASTFSLGAINELIVVLSGFSTTAGIGESKTSFFTPLMSSQMGCEIIWQTYREPKFQTKAAFNGGVLCSHIYPLKGNDRLFFIPCLDDRLLPTQENARLKTCYTLESQKIRPSIHLSRKEQILLKNISLYDELTIPLWIYYMEENPKRLESPLFGALIEAFLLNRVGFIQNPPDESWGTWVQGLFSKKTPTLLNAAENQELLVASILSTSLQDENSQVAENLLEFLEKKLESIRNTSTLDQTKSSLLRVLAISYRHLSYLHTKNPGNTLIAKRLKRAEDLLLKQLSLDPNSSISTLIQATVVSLYPYIKNNPEFLSICKQVLDKMIYNDEFLKAQSYQMQADFREGVTALSSHIFPPDQLPFFVLVDIYYLLANKTPEVSLEGNVYSFMDGDVQAQVIITSPSSYIFKRKIKNHEGQTKWFSHHKSPESCMKNPPPPLSPSGFLSRQALDYWVHEEGLDSEIFAFPLGTFSSPAFYIQKGQVIKGEDPTLSLASLTQNSFLQRLLFLEESKAILPWKDSANQVVLIEFPDYGFCLQRETKKGSKEIRWKFNHTSFQNTYLDFSRPCMELEPYSHYLPLVTAKGKKMLVMPNQIFASNQVGFSGNQDPAGSKSKTPELFRFDLTPQGELILPSESKPLLSLFFLALHIKDYARAETILKQLTLNRAEWGEEEISIIKDHLHGVHYPQEFDRSPYACRLRIRLLCLQEKLGVPLSTEEADILLGDYKTCKNQKTQGILNDLSSEEEFVIDKLLNQSIPKESIFYPLISQVPDLPIIRELGAMTFNMLEKIAPSLISWGLLEITSSSSDPQEDRFLPHALQGYSYSLSEWFKDNLKTLQAHLESPEPIPLEMRPGNLLFLNFLYYYKVATHGTQEEKLQLKKLLELSRYAKFDTANKLCYDILLGILHMKETESVFHRHPFPSIDSVLSYQELDKLCRDIETFYTKNKPTPFPHFPQISCSLPERPLKSSPFSITGTAERVFLPSTFSLEDSSPAPIKIRASLLRQEDTLQDLENTITHLEKEIAKVPSSTKKRKSRRIRQLQQQLATYTKQREQLDNSAKIATCKALQEKYDFPSKDPCIISSCATTRKGIEQFIENLPKSQEKSLKSINTQEVNSLLDESIENLSAATREKQEAIEAQLRSYPTKELQFQLKMKLLKTLTLKEALVFFAQEEDHKILESNPSLEDSLSEFKELMATYLKEKTEMQHLIRLKNLFLQATTAPTKEEADFAYRTFLDHLNSPRAYDRNTPDFQALLVFEELNDLRLRAEQVTALITMTSEESKNIEFEARTGFGKSQVLIPLWLFLKSRIQEEITIMVVPASLLPDQVKHLQRLLGKPLSTGIHEITFSREQASNLAALQKLHTDLLDARKYKRILITNIGSLHGMTSLALKEALSKESKNPSPIGRALVEELQAISKLIKSKSNVFIDESRECLYSRQRFDYAMGSPIRISCELCQEMSLFWDQYFFDPFIQSRWNFKFLPEGPGKELTEENFEELKCDLAEIVAKDLFQGATESLKQDCISHLTGGEASIQLKNAIQTLTSGQKRQYALCHSQISIHLKKTLMNKCGERYDLNEDLIAFPYKAGTPQPSSEFATLDDLLNFTFQANFKRVIEEDIVNSYIKTLQRNTLKDAGFDLTPAYILFQKIQEELDLENLDQLQASDIKKITNLLNSDLRRFKLPFIALSIIPNITFVPGKISGTSFNLFLHLTKTHMASGTTDPDTLHPKMTASANPAAPIGNLLSIYERSKIQIIPEDPKEALICLLQDPDYKENSPPIIIDVGGKFLDLAEETILSLFFAGNPHIEGVSYYDEEGKHLLRMRGSTTSISRELSSLDIHKIGVFIREGNAIGSDTPMPITGKGKVTVKHETTESFFLQGAGRMRGLSQGQTLDVALSEKDLRVIESDGALTVPELLKHLKIQEGKQKGLDYFFSLKLYLETLIEEPLWETEDTDELLHRFSLMEDLIVSSTLTDSVKTLYQTRKLLTAQEAIRLLKESLLEPLRQKNLPFIDINRIESAFDAQVKYDKLLSLIPGGDDEIQESITEAEQESTQEITQENIVDNTREKEIINFEALPILPWEGNYTALFTGEPSEEFCNTSVYLSPNFSRLSKSASTPLHKASYLYLLEIGPTGKKKIMALDLHDAQQALSYMKEQGKKSSGQAKTYLVSHTGILTSDDETPFSRLSELFAPSNKTEITEITLIHKILTGNPLLNAGEKRFIKEQNRATLNNLLHFTAIYTQFWPELEEISSCIKSAL